MSVFESEDIPRCALAKAGTVERPNCFHLKPCAKVAYKKPDKLGKHFFSCSEPFMIDGRKNPDKCNFFMDEKDWNGEHMKDRFRVRVMRFTKPHFMRLVNEEKRMRTDTSYETFLLTVNEILLSRMHSDARYKMATAAQGSQEWFDSRSFTFIFNERKCRLAVFTSSVLGSLLGYDTYTKKEDIFREMLWQCSWPTDATEYGNLKEDHVKDAYIKYLEERHPDAKVGVSELGLLPHDKYHILADSTDGDGYVSKWDEETKTWATTRFAVEIKVPYNMRRKSVTVNTFQVVGERDVVVRFNDKPVETSDDNELTFFPLNDMPNGSRYPMSTVYWIQCQMHMDTHNRDFCHFIVANEEAMQITRVERDYEFFHEKIAKPLIQVYYNDYLPLVYKAAMGQISEGQIV